MKRRKTIDCSPAKKRSLKRRTASIMVGRKKRNTISDQLKQEQEVLKQAQAKDNSKKDFQRRSCILKCKLEYMRLQKEWMDKSIPPKGIYVLPGRDKTEWHGVKFVQGGPYKGLILKFFFKLPPRFPAEHLVVKSFQPKPQDMFHPLVHPLTGVIQYFANPSPMPPRSQPFINEILNGLHDIFENPQLTKWRPDDCQNPLALTLASQNPIEFNNRTQQCIHRSQEGKYVNHPNSLIRFNPMSEHEYEIEKAKICVQENLEALERPQEIKSAPITPMTCLGSSNRSFENKSALNESRIQPPQHSLNQTMIAT